MQSPMGTAELTHSSKFSLTSEIIITDFLRARISLSNDRLYEKVGLTKGKYLQNALSRWITAS